MRKHIASLTLAAVTMVLMVDAFATTPGSNNKAFQNCDVALCVNRDGSIEYNLYGEDVRLFETLEMRNLHRGVIAKSDEFSGVSRLQLSAEYYCINNRPNTRLGEFNAARKLDWEKLPATIAKCGARAGR